MTSNTVLAHDVLSDPFMIEQGFLGRMLIAWPTSRVGERQILDRVANERDCALAEIQLKNFHERIRQILEKPLPLNPGDPTELVPRILKLSDRSTEMLIDFYNRTEVGQKAGGPFFHIQSFASKIAEQACRVAGVLALFGDIEATEVSPECMKNAIEIADWYLLELLRLRDCGFVTPELRDAEMLRIWLSENRAGRDINIRDIVRNGPRPAHNAQSSRQLLEILEDHGWIHRLPEYTSVNGTKSKRAWSVHP